MIRKHDLKKSNKHFAEFLADFTFLAWIIVTFFWERETAGRIMLVVFAGVVALLMVFKGSISGNLTSTQSVANLFFLSYLAFIIYNHEAIYYSSFVLDMTVAKSMYKTLWINFIFIYFMYRYCILKDKMNEVLNIYVIANMIIMVIIIAVSGKEILSGRLGGAMEINANVVALAMINCLVISMHKNANEKKAINTIIIIVCIGAILLTGSRKGLIGMAMGLILYQGMSKGLKKYKNLFIVAVVVVAAYFLIMNVEPLYNIAGYRVEALLSYFKGESYDENSLETRDGFAELGWKYVGRNPWFGYGLGCFSVLKGAFGTYSHNNYLELLFGCGIIGTALYYLGYVYILFGHLKLYYKHKIMDSKPYIVLMIIRMFLEYAYVSYFERTSILFIIISLAALQLSKSKLQSEEKNDEQIDETIKESI